MKNDEAIKDTKAGEDEIKEVVGGWEVLNKVLRLLNIVGQPFRGFLPSNGKGDKNVKIIAQKWNNFHTHFQQDFTKSRIFPMDYICQKIRGK